MNFSHLFRIYDPIILHSQIPLKSQQHDRYIIPLPHIHPRGILPPHLLRIDQAAPVINGIADDDEIGAQQGIVLWGGSVVELEAKVFLDCCADIVDVWLVGIAEDGEGDGEGERKRGIGWFGVAKIWGPAAYASGGWGLGLEKVKVVGIGNFTRERWFCRTRDRRVGGS